MKYVQGCPAIFFFVLLWIASSSKAQSPSFIATEGKGIPVVMLQGGSYTFNIFDPHAKELSALYKVIRIERLNISCVKTNTAIPGSYSVRMESERMAHLLDSLSIHEPVVLIGHSYGAVIALDLALNHPDKIRSLVLVEPPAFWIAKQKGEHPAGMNETIAVTKDFTPNSTITEQQMEKFRCALANCAAEPIRNNPQWGTWVKNIPLLQGLSVIDQHVDSIQRLHVFRKPVMIVTGNKTAVFHKRINEIVLAELPNAAALTLEGGHGACISTGYNEFMKAVKEFIAAKK